MSDLENILNALVRYRSRYRFMAKSISGTVRAEPAAFLNACRALGVESFSLPYLNRYTLEADVSGRSITESVLAFGCYQFEAMQTVARLIDCASLDFVNVGANIGTSCLNAHSVGFRHFVAVEPVSRNFDLLERNLRRNQLDARTELCAIGSLPGVAAINLNPSSSGRHSFKNTFAGATTEQVEVKRLDNLVLERPYFLWLDTEGFEHEVLSSGPTSLEYCRGACVEITPELTGTEIAVDTLDLLLERLPVLYRPDGERVDPTEQRANLASGDVRQVDIIALPSDQGK